MASWSAPCQLRFLICYVPITRPVSVPVVRLSVKSPLRREDGWHLKLSVILVKDGINWATLGGIVGLLFFFEVKERAAILCFMYVKGAKGKGSNLWAETPPPSLPNTLTWLLSWFFSFVSCSWRVEYYIRYLLTNVHMITPAIHAVTMGNSSTGKQRIRELNMVVWVVETSGYTMKATPADSMTGM